MFLSVHVCMCACVCVRVCVCDLPPAVVAEKDDDVSLARPFAAESSLAGTFRGWNFPSVEEFGQPQRRHVMGAIKAAKECKFVVAPHVKDAGLGGLRACVCVCEREIVCVCV